MSFTESLCIVAVIILICLLITLFGGDDNYPDPPMYD